MSLKRKAASDSESSGSSSFGGSDDEFDATKILGSKKVKFDEISEDESGDETLDQLLHDSIAKRNVKSGTEVLKKVKGKKNIVKGEVGGGSFQSMGQ
jgi:ATP-dependent RNA helicase DDX54/DBP10